MDALLLFLQDLIDGEPARSAIRYGVGSIFLLTGLPAFLAKRFYVPMIWAPTGCLLGLLVLSKLGTQPDGVAVSLGLTVGAMGLGLFCYWFLWSNILSDIGRNSPFYREFAHPLLLFSTSAFVGSWALTAGGYYLVNGHHDPVFLIWLGEPLQAITSNTLVVSWVIVGLVILAANLWDECQNTESVYVWRVAGDAECRVTVKGRMPRRITATLGGSARASWSGFLKYPQSIRFEGRNGFERLEVRFPGGAQAELRLNGSLVAHHPMNESAPETEADRG